MTPADDMRPEPDLRCITDPKICRLSVDGECTCIDQTMAADCDDREV